ncbi:hypothetical protein [Halomonas elongata]|uniref:Uncharacterized protein n=1 Tax=Halomonas elongata (strain ATCC 33173 / DSM 2581 / NBRC 15536 / NCIMB 2198 / 1H9) TaxID=768066 RepID=A0ABZ0TGP0_HALED|nr:hypothetical protein [Halomonas elongata]WBF19820.1 hypothetical protein LM502_09080 [Halomonas elongata]WPU48689.1 hypothetical protein SR933_07305 [Halomonas elongata DSM 2581]
MNWDRVGKYHIQCGEYTICRTHHSGTKLFTVWYGNERIGIRHTAKEAMALAESHETGKRNGNEKGNGRKRGQ